MSNQALVPLSVTPELTPSTQGGRNKRQINRLAFSLRDGLIVIFVANLMLSCYCAGRAEGRLQILFERDLRSILTMRSLEEVRGYNQQAARCDQAARRNGENAR
jgi:hypothetical protein